MRFTRLCDRRSFTQFAEVAGRDWLQRATRSLALLTSQKDADADGIGTMLLADIRTAFDQAAGDRMFSENLIESLCALPERPWREIRKGKEITGAWLARHLRGFTISSRKIRVGDEVKQGYLREDFAEAWERYLPTAGDSKRNTGTNTVNIGDSDDSQMEQLEPVFHCEASKKLNTGAVCSTVPPANTVTEAERDELLI